MFNHKKNSNKHRVRFLPKKANIVDYCARNFSIFKNKMAVEKAIEKEEISLNGNAATPEDFVRNGDFILVQKEEKIQPKESFPERNKKRTKKPKFDIEMPIVYEDDWLVIVNKPGGIAVNGNRNKTVENAIKGQYQRSSEPDALPSPVATHRLDVPTKGLVILAKTKTALVRINKAFQNKKVDKIYYAVVHKEISETGRIEEPIEGKPSITEFERIEVSPSRLFGHFSLVRLMPITGRTHQLRIHLKNLGHLIVGDKLYAESRKTILGKGLFLCACSLNFPHPISNKMINVEIPLPSRFKRLLEKERKRF